VGESTNESTNASKRKASPLGGEGARRLKSRTGRIKHKKSLIEEENRILRGGGIGELFKWKK